MKDFDCIIFDLDGTLASTNQLIYDSFNHVCARYLGKTLTPEEIHEHFGPTEEVILRKLFPDDYAEVVADYMAYYAENHAGVALYEGMRETLDELKGRDVFLSVFTGKGRRTTEITLEKLGVLEIFDSIVSGDDVTHHKPSSDGVERVLAESNAARERTLMIGDNAVDGLASREAGIKVAAALWDSYGEEKLLALEPDYDFRRVEDLRRFLLDRV